MSRADLQQLNSKGVSIVPDKFYSLDELGITLFNDSKMIKPSHKIVLLHLIKKDYASKGSLLELSSSDICDGTGIRDNHTIVDAQKILHDLNILSYMTPESRNSRLAGMIIHHPDMWGTKRDDGQYWRK